MTICHPSLLQAVPRAWWPIALRSGACAMLALVLASCSPSSQQSPASQPPTIEPPTIEPAISTVVTGSSSAVEQAPATPLPRSPQTAEPETIPTPAPVRKELSATDPTQVVLGGGRPALVEFFAFW